MKFDQTGILFASLVGSKVAESIPRFGAVQNELAKHVLPHFTSSFLRFSGATVIFIAFCSNEYNNYFI